MSTYLQGIPDYLPQIQATTPNLQLGMQALNMRQSAYNANKKQLSNLYGSLLNSPMIREKNIEDRDQFFKLVNQDIKKLSGMDLSLDQNSVAGSQLFNQLTDNKDIVKDMSWTKNLQSEQRRFENLKNCTDPKVCKEMYWEGGASALNFRAEEFRNATDEEARGMANAKAVGKIDLTAMATEMANTADLNVTLDTLSGNYIYTDKNGQNVEGALQGLLNGHIGNNPAVKAYMTEQAYVQRKTYVQGAVASGEFESEEAASENYFKTTAGKFLEETRSQQTQVESALSSTNALLESTKSRIESQNLPVNSPLRKQYEDLSMAQKQLEQSKTVYEQRISDYQGFVNNGFSKRGLESLDKSLGGQMLSSEIAGLANVLSFKNAERTMAADDFALEERRSANRRIEQKEKIKLEQEAENGPVTGPPEANHAAVSEGEVTVNEDDPFAAVTQVQEVFQDNDIALIKATGLITEKIISKSFTTIKGGSNISEPDKALAQENVISLLDQAYKLYADDKNILNPNVKGGFTELVSLDKQTEQNFKTLKNTKEASAKWASMSKPDKLRYLNKVGEKGVKKILNHLSADGNDKLFRGLETQLKSSTNINPLYENLRNDVDVKSALASGSINQKANAALGQWMGEQRSSVIDKVRVGTKTGKAALEASLWLEAAVDEDGQIVGFEEYIDNYVSNLDSKGSIKQSQKKELIKRAIIGYYGEGNFPNTFTNIELVGGKLSPIATAVGLSVAAGAIPLANPALDAVIDLFSDKDYDYRKESRDSGYRNDVLQAFNNKFFEGKLKPSDPKFKEAKGGIANLWKQAFNTYGEINENSILAGLGSTVNKTLTWSSIQGTQPASEGFLSLRDFNKDISNNKDSKAGDVIYHIGGSQKNAKNSEAAKSIYDGLITNMINQTGEKKSDRPIVTMSYNDKIVIGEDGEAYTRVNLKMNSDYITKQSKIDGDSGQNFQQIYDLDDTQLKNLASEGVTVYLKRSKANNKLHTLLKKSPLEHALDMNGSYVAYEDAKTGTKLEHFKGENGQDSIKGRVVAGFNSETNEYIYKTMDQDVPLNLTPEEVILWLKQRVEKVNIDVDNLRTK